MGRVRAPHGVRGWLKVQPYTEAVDGLLGYRRWWIGTARNWRQCEMLEGRVQGGDLVVRLEGIEDRDQAAAVRGWEIAVAKADMPVPAQGEYYWADLVGLRVVNLQGEELGRIAEVFATGANDVIVVRGERERLIPFIAPVVIEVAPDEARVVVDWGMDY